MVRSTATSRSPRRSRLGVRSRSPRATSGSFGSPKRTTRRTSTYRRSPAFFGVPVSYFFDDGVTDRVDQQLEKLRSEQVRLNEIAGNSDVQLMAMRAGELSPQR